MQKLSVLLWAGLCVGLVWVLNTPQKTVPALGTLLSPSHGFWQQLEGTAPELPDEVASTYLQKPVEVVWDSLLIPHIFAETDADLYFVQGYITAQMRLWQMDFQTRAAAGRISEVVGDAALQFDKDMRRKGMLSGAQKSLDLCLQDSAVKEALLSYAAGVNAYINQLTERHYPLEYKLLGMQPEAWSPLRTMLLLEYMANMLNTYNSDIEYTNFLAQFGYADWHLLYGGKDDKTQPIVNTPGMWQFPVAQPLAPPTDVVTAPKELVDKTLPDPNNGSNNWAVSPQKSANGHAMLANDPHLQLNLPALWFTVHLSSPSQNVMGASMPGNPGVIIGFNEKIAWGFTNAQRDLVDWYKVQFADATKTAILVDGKQEKLTQIIEKIEVKGGKTVYDTIYECSFGRIANFTDLPTAETNTGWAYRWIGQEASGVGLALNRLNKAKGFDDYLAATSNFHSPAQNIIYADVTGTIGICVQGRFLARAKNEGLFLRDGTKAANAWQQYIPGRYTVNEFNPERGFVSSANQFPVDSTYPYFIAAHEWESYRNRRINHVLGEDTSVSVEDMMNLHSDNYNLEAAENLPYFLQVLDASKISAEGQKAMTTLRNWNYHSQPELVAPVFYDAWRNAILELAWDELLYEDKPMALPSEYRTFKLLHEQNVLRWWDIQSTPETEDGKALISAAFAQALAQVASWQEAHGDTKHTLNWGNYKATRITHLTRQTPLSRENVFIGGNRGIVNATTKTHGPSWRQVVELDPEGVKAWGIYPGGQSGNPGSRYYTNWVDAWAAGKYHSLDVTATMSTLAYEKSIKTTVFKPAK